MFLRPAAMVGEAEPASETVGGAACVGVLPTGDAANLRSVLGVPAVKGDCAERGVYASGLLAGVDRVCRVGNCSASGCTVPKFGGLGLLTRGAACLAPAEVLGLTTETGRRPSSSGAGRCCNTTVGDVTVPPRCNGDGVVGGGGGGCCCCFCC